MVLPLLLTTLIYFNILLLSRKSNLGDNSEHINYFNINSVQKIFHKNGFKTKDIKTSFPIDIFLLMGMDYISNKNLGKNAHTLRKKFEENLKTSGLEDLLISLQDNFTKLNIGRQIDLIVQKR